MTTLKDKIREAVMVYEYDIRNEELVRNEEVLVESVVNETKDYFDGAFE